MKHVIDVGADRPSCFLIDNLEYARRAQSAAGIGRRVLEEPLKLHLLIPVSRPETENGLWPLVIFVVGGAFKNPKVTTRIPWLCRLAERGFAVAMPEYRGSESAVFPAMMEDIHSAVRYLRKNAARYGFDPDRIVMMGGSAGAHIAVQTAFAPADFNDPEDDLSIPVNVNGVIDIYGTSDPAALIADDADIGEWVMSFPCQLTKCFDRERLPQALAPMNLLQYVSDDAELPPVLIVHGDADSLVPIRQSELFYEALEKCGKDAEFYIVRGAEHADQIFFEKEMMDIYEAFIRRVTES